MPVNENYYYLEKKQSKPRLTVYDEIVFNQSSYKLKRTICGSVAFKIKSPNFSILRHAWNGNCNSDPLITMLGKSRRWTSSGSNMPFLVTIICLGCSSTGNERISAATSSAVFHLANWKIQQLYSESTYLQTSVLGLNVSDQPTLKCELSSRTTDQS